MQGYSLTYCLFPIEELVCCSYFHLVLALSDRRRCLTHLEREENKLLNTHLPRTKYIIEAP
jgi:hypothetical protein